MIPKEYNDAERAAYARARADAARDFQATLTEGVRPMRDAAWIEGYAAAADDAGRDPEPPADRPYAPPALPEVEEL